MKGNKIPALLFLGLGLFFVIPSFSMGLLSTTSDKVPGAGFFPLLMGLVLVVCSIILYCRVKETEKYFELNEEKKKNFLITLAALMTIILTLILWKTLKIFYFAIFVECIVFNRFLFNRPWRFSIIFTTVLVGLVYLGFTVGLSINFVV